MYYFKRDNNLTLLKPTNNASKANTYNCGYLLSGI